VSCHSRAWLPGEESRIPDSHSALKSRHCQLVDSINLLLARRAICLISLQGQWPGDVIKFFKRDEPVDAEASPE
jgi:hypothetical protein